MIVEFCFNTIPKHSSNMRNYINMTKHSINYQRKALSILLILLKHATPLTFNTHLRAINYYYNIYIFFTINWIILILNSVDALISHVILVTSKIDLILGFRRQCVFFISESGSGFVYIWQCFVKYSWAIETLWRWLFYW